MFIEYNAIQRTYRVRKGDAVRTATAVSLASIGDGDVNEAAENARACPGVEIPVYSRIRQRVKHSAVRQ